MPTINISKIKLRRGTNDQRRLVILDQGEPVYTTDTKRVFVGTGTLSGGFVVGSKVHSPLINFFSLSTVVAETGDLVNVNNKFYQLTGANFANVNSWADVSARVDSTFLSYNSNNHITLNIGSISAAYIDSDTIGDGLVINSGILQLDYTTQSLEISSNKLAIKASGITEREVSSTALSYGILGGSGTPIQLDVDPAYFVFTGNTLSLSSNPSSLEFDDLDAAWFGDGITFDGPNELISAEINAVDGDTITLTTGEIAVNPAMFGVGIDYDTATNTVSSILANVDNSTLERSSTGIISLSDINASAVNEWPMVSVDDYGRVVSLQNSILDIFKCDSALSPTLNGTNSLSSIFNGSPTGIYAGSGPLTMFKALSSDDTTVVELSSAGFIVFEGNYSSRAGIDANPITRFAIPIFRF